MLEQRAALAAMPAVRPQQRSAHPQPAEAHIQASSQSKPRECLLQPLDAGVRTVQSVEERTGMSCQLLRRSTNN